jgi:hypothetical protein
LGMPWMAGPIVGNRPPLAPLPVSLSIRHSDELLCGTGLFDRRRAHLVLSALVGAVAMARAVGDVGLSDDILTETAAALKDL